MVKLEWLLDIMIKNYIKSLAQKFPAPPFTDGIVGAKFLTIYISRRKEKFKVEF